MRQRNKRGDIITDISEFSKQIRSAIASNNVQRLSDPAITEGNNPEALAALIRYAETLSKASERSDELLRKISGRENIIDADAKIKAQAVTTLEQKQPKLIGKQKAATKLEEAKQENQQSQDALAIVRQWKQTVTEDNASISAVRNDLLRNILIIGTALLEQMRAQKDQDSAQTLELISGIDALLDNNDLNLSDKNMELLGKYQIEHNNVFHPHPNADAYDELDAALEAAAKPKADPKEQTQKLEDLDELEQLLADTELEGSLEIAAPKKLTPKTNEDDDDSTYESTSDDEEDEDEEVAFSRLNGRLRICLSVAQGNINKNPDEAIRQSREALAILEEIKELDKRYTRDLDSKTVTATLNAYIQSAEEEKQRLAAPPPPKEEPVAPENDEAGSESDDIEDDPRLIEMEKKNPALFDLLNDAGILPTDEEDYQLIEKIYGTRNKIHDLDQESDALKKLLIGYSDNYKLTEYERTQFVAKINDVVTLAQIEIGNGAIQIARATEQYDAQNRSEKSNVEEDEPFEIDKISGSDSPAKLPDAPKSEADMMHDGLDDLDNEEPPFKEEDTNALLGELDAARKQQPAPPASDKGKEEYSVSLPDLQLNEKSGRARELLNNIGEVGMRMESLISSGSTLNARDLEAITNPSNRILRLAEELKREVEGLNNLNPKPDQSNYSTVMRTIDDIFHRCEAIENVITAKSHELIDVEKIAVHSDWSRSLDRMEDYIRAWTAALNDPRLTRDRAGHILAFLNEQNDWGERTPAGQALSARIDAIKSKLPDDPDLLALDRRDIAISDARGTAIVLAQSKIAALNAPPAPPPPPIVVNDDDRYFFFAKNAAEHERRRNEVVHIHSGFSNCQQKADRAILAAEGLLKTATSTDVKAKIIENIDTQLHELKLYKGLLEDNIRRKIDPAAENPNKPGEHRDAGFDAANMSNTTVAAMQQRLTDTDLLIQKLVQAKNNIQALAAAPSHLSIYKKSIHAQSMLRNNTGINFHEPQSFATRDTALGAAQQFFSVYGRRPPDNSLNSIYGVNPRPDQLVAKNNFVFTATEANTKRGSIPIGVLQATNLDQTYSKQEVIISAAELKSLNELPLGSKAKQEKIKEQLIFVSNMIETGLAAVKTNGPVTLEHWPANLQKIAAAYCKEMGYDLRPKSLINNMKPKEMEALRTTVKNMANDNPQFSAFIHDAEKRKDLKESQLPQTSPRPR